MCNGIFGGVLQADCGQNLVKVGIDWRHASKNRVENGVKNSGTGMTREDDDNVVIITTKIATVSSVKSVRERLTSDKNWYCIVRLIQYR
jgi:hypothetical protein